MLFQWLPVSWQKDKVDKSICDFYQLFFNQFCFASFFARQKNVNKTWEKKGSMIIIFCFWSILFRRAKVSPKFWGYNTLLGGKIEIIFCKLIDITFVMYLVWKWITHLWISHFFLFVSHFLYYSLYFCTRFYRSVYDLVTYSHWKNQIYWYRNFGTHIYF